MDANNRNDLAGGAPSANKSRAILAAGVLLPIVYAAVVVRTIPPSRIGDGNDYLISTVAFAETHRPFITQGLIDRFNALLRREPLHNGYAVVGPRDYGFLAPVYGPAGPTYEPAHFWFLGLLTAPFYWLTRATGLNFAHSYTMLAVALWIAVILAAARLHGDSGVIAATILLVCSPAIWYIDKAHSEFLTLSAVLSALILADRDHPLWAALAISLAATQNPALSPLVAVLLAWGLWRRRKSLTSADLTIAAAAVALTALSPAYYYVRHGILNPLIAAGYSKATAISVRRIVTLFFDPDIGLYPNWPFGLLLILGGAAALLRRDGRGAVARFWRQKPSLCAFLGAFLLIEPLAHASQYHVNTGGTVHVWRYGLWYVPLHYPIVRGALRRAALIGLSPWRWAGGTAAALLAVSAIWFNDVTFAPQKPEVYWVESPAARGLYSHAPSLFDPVPSIFVSRTAIPIRAVPYQNWQMDTRQFAVEGEALYARGIWGFSVPSCRKIYVLSGMLRSGHADPGQRPYGCTALVDPHHLFALAQAHGAARDFYLNLSAGEVRGAYARLPLEHRLVFSDPRASDYLGEGWSVPEAGFRWTDGRVARLGFSVSPEDRARAGGRLALRFDAAGMTAEVPVQTVRTVVNGDARVLAWPRGQRPVINIPVVPDADGNVLVEFQIEHPLAHPVAQESRALGLMCFSMELVAVEGGQPGAR